MDPMHSLGRDDSDITLLEYGSYNCPYCQAAHEVVARLRDRFGERLRYAFRHRPITGNALAREAAELAEYAAEVNGGFWEAHDVLMKRGPHLERHDLDALAARLALPPREAEPAAWQRARER